MSDEKDKKLEKNFEIFENKGGHLATPKREFYGHLESIFSSYNNEEEAMKDILDNGENYVDYIVVPSYRVTNF